MTTLETKISHYSAHQRLAAHADYQTRISVVVAGTLHEEVSGVQHNAGVGSVVIKPGHVIHRNQFGPNGARTLSVGLPSSWLAHSEIDALLQRWQWFHHGPCAVAASRLWFALSQREPDSAELLLELLASVPTKLASDHPPAWLQRVHAQLHDQRGIGCSLRLVAPLIGVHPIYLARKFRQHYGCTLSDYAQALRIQSALELMSTQHLPLSEIASICGFADQSHLSRAVRQRLSISPKSANLLLRSAHLARPNT